MSFFAVLDAYYRLKVDANSTVLKVNREREMEEGSLSPTPKFDGRWEKLETGAGAELAGEAKLVMVAWETPSQWAWGDLTQGRGQCMCCWCL